MGREQHRHTLSYVLWEAIQGLTHSLGQSLQERWLQMPVARDLQLQIIAVQIVYRVLQGTYVAAHNDGRVLRRHDDPHQRLSSRCHLWHYISDKRWGETH